MIYTAVKRKAFLQNERKIFTLEYDICVKMKYTITECFKMFSSMRAQHRKKFLITFSLKHTKVLFSWVNLLFGPTHRHVFCIPSKKKGRTSNQAKRTNQNITKRNVKSTVLHKKKTNDAQLNDKCVFIYRLWIRLRNFTMKFYVYLFLIQRCKHFDCIYMYILCLNV